MLTDLVLLFELKDLRQGAHLTLHAVDALNNDEDLLPGAPGPGLPICNVFPQQGFKMLDIIVCKNLQ